MALDRVSAIRMAAEIAGLTNHDERVKRDLDYAYALTRNEAMLREYHAVLGIANRLELLVKDSEAPSTFDVLDLVDGALRPPFLMGHRDEKLLLKLMRARLASSPIAKVEVTALRDVILHAYVYDEELRRSVLKAVDRTEGLSFRKAG